MKALYPFVGGSAASHKFNLKDPRDLDAAYRLVFNGGWVHSSTGAKPNGTTGYANTFIAPNAMNQNSIHVSFYSRTDIDELKVDISAGSGSSFVEIISRYSNRFYLYMNTAQGEVNINNSSTGFFIGNRITSSTLSFFKNDLKMANGNRGSNPPSNYSFYLAAENNTGVSNYYSSKEQAFASIGDGLTDGEAANFYNAVQKFQTTLGRQIGSPIVSDSDAQAFLNAAGITDYGQATAVNTLVTDLKGAGIWTKMKAIYPFVGGSATSHKFNLKDPRDVDAAFRLQFNGGWTHSSTGAKPNGSNGYADTKLNPSISLTTYSNHLSFYSRTSTGYAGEIPLGVGDNYGRYAQALVIRRDNNLSAYDSGNSTSANRITYSNTDGSGFYLGITLANNNRKYYRNNITMVSSTSVLTQDLANANVFLGAYNEYNITGANYYTNKETAFASIGDGLTDTEASAFYTAVQKFQTSLGRQIGTPVLAEGQTAGLLDTYSSAAAAYSLRKLRTGYYGFAIRVRRSSDNLEQDISFKADGTLDTASLLAFVGSGNGFVTTWYDQSGNNRNITQSTSADQPQIVNNGVVYVDSNNKPRVRGYVNSATNLSLSISSTSQPVTVFGVVNYSSLTIPYTYPYALNLSTLQLPIISAENGYARIYAGSNLVNSTLLSINTNYLSYGLLNSGSSQVGINNTINTGNAGDGSINVVNQIRLFNAANNGAALNGYLSEVIIYFSNQSTNRTGISSNINSYYSIY
jgi:hypothetical protein